MTTSLILSLALTLSGTPGTSATSPLALPDDRKPRVVVMTDIGGDPDDKQSLVRFLLYACDFHVEGLLTGFGHGHDKDTRPDLLRKGVAAYGEVVENLRLHRADYPSAARRTSAASRCGGGKRSSRSDVNFVGLARPGQCRQRCPTRQRLVGNGRSGPRARPQLRQPALWLLRRR